MVLQQPDQLWQQLRHGDAGRQGQVGAAAQPDHRDGAGCLSHAKPP
jgi:hypothetical protein